MHSQMHRVAARTLLTGPTGGRSRTPTPKTACSSVYYIMSGGMPGEDLLSSGISVTTAWVVSTMAAIEAAF